jgi:hypothetical protein
MYATAILRGPMNSDLSQYIAIHRNERRISKIRKNYPLIQWTYTIDYFPICHYIHRQLSPSISVR